MSIRPIDLMVLYSKLGDVEKAAQGQQQAPKLSQEQIAAQEVVRKEIEHSKVLNSPHDDGAGRIKEEPERKREKKDKKRNEQEPEAEVDDQQPGSAVKSSFHVGSIDIKA